MRNISKYIVMPTVSSHAKVLASSESPQVSPAILCEDLDNLCDDNINARDVTE